MVSHQPSFTRICPAGEFYVQIGAFTEARQCRKTGKNDLPIPGIPPSSRKILTGEPMVHQVQVYAGKTIQIAKRAEKALLERGWVGAFVVAR